MQTLDLEDVKIIYNEDRISKELIKKRMDIVIRGVYLLALLILCIACITVLIDDIIPLIDTKSTLPWLLISILLISLPILILISDGRKWLIDLKSLISKANKDNYNKILTFMKIVFNTQLIYVSTASDFSITSKNIASKIITELHYKDEGKDKDKDKPHIASLEALIFFIKTEKEIINNIKQPNKQIQIKIDLTDNNKTTITLENK